MKRPAPRVRLSLLLLGGVLALAAARASVWAEGPPATARSSAGIPVDSLVRWGSSRLAAGRIAEAESLGRLAVAAAEPTPGKDSLALASSYDLLARVFRGAARFGDPETRLLAERAAGIAQRRLGLEHPTTLAYQSTLATVIMMAGDPNGALPIMQRIYDIRVRTLGADHTDVGLAANMLGSLQLKLGDYGAAESLMLQGERILERNLGSQHPDVGRVWHNIGVLRYTQRNLAAADSAAQRAFQIREAALGADHPATLQTRNLLAEIAHLLGDYRRAISLHEKIIATARASAETDSASLALALGNLGNLREEMGDYREAEALQREALKIREQCLGPEHPDVAMSLTNLGNLLGDENRWAEAKARYERAVAIDEKALGPDHPSVAEDLDNLAICLDFLGDFAAGERLHRRVIAIREKTLGRDSPQMADALDKYARSLGLQGKLTAAREYQLDALGARIRTLGPAHPLVALSLRQIAVLDWVAGERDSALTYSLRAEQVSREHLRLTARALPELQALRYASTRVNGLDLAMTAALESRRSEDVRLAWDAVVRSRAEVLDEMARRAQEVAGVRDSQTVLLAQVLSSARKRLADLVVRGPEDDSLEQYRRRLTEAEQAKSQAEEALAIRSDAFRRERGSERLGLEDVRRALPEGFGIAAYVRYQRSSPSGAGRIQANTAADHPVASGAGKSASDVPSYAAFLLASKRAQPMLVPLGSASRVDSLVHLWQDAIRRPSSPGDPSHARERAYRSVAGALRAAIWDPLRSGLQGVADALVIPDGELNLVSLASLPTDRTSYLVEQDPAIHYLSAERDVVTPAGESSEGAGMLALGDPDFEAQSLGSGPGPRKGVFRGASSACGDFRALHFSGLIASRQEVDDLAVRWKGQPGSITVLLGQDASEARFKREATGKRILHLATHGFFLGGRCGESTPGAARGIGRIATTQDDPMPMDTENPLVRAGLAMAGANRRQSAREDEDDGVLTAEEISALDLRSADWAVLSACETGVGEVQAGEGVFGLRRAFQIAGARSLIMSLWPVEDRSARQWMSRLYEARLGRRASTVDAVREASLGLLKERRARGETTHPFYWGAFVAAGDWR